MEPIISNSCLKHPTFITYSEKSGLWVTDISSRRILNIGKNTISRVYTLKELRICPGGTNYKIAFSDSLILVFESNRVLIYNLDGNYLRTYQGTDYEEKYDGLIDMDNCGNSYFFKGFNLKQFLKVSPSGKDTSLLILPDSFIIHNLAWWKTYRVRDTLYLFCRYSVIRKDKGTFTGRGFLVFVGDSLGYVIPESDFEGGLPEIITDFAVPSYGLIWVVDINNRVVQRYRLIPR